MDEADGVQTRNGGGAAFLDSQGCFPGIALFVRPPRTKNPSAYRWPKQATETATPCPS